MEIIEQVKVKLSAAMQAAVEKGIRPIKGYGCKRVDGKLVGLCIMAALWVQANNIMDTVEDGDVGYSSGAAPLLGIDQDEARRIREAWDGLEYGKDEWTLLGRELRETFKPVPSHEVWA